MRIEISLAKQNLRLFDKNGDVLMSAMVSTAKNGAGEKINSECTPRGQHRIRAKIGDGCPANAVFEGRRPTGEIYCPELRVKYPNRDWILTRILWLSGTQLGFNRLGSVDTMRRYIYIHGAPDDEEMGVPTSHGCVRMSNADIISLFDMVDVGVPVMINV
ncbi:MAG: L,D-transpeptidase [Arenicellales bacterium]|nr:L,D-transpeptidase [Arenicellales bacterium]